MFKVTLTATYIAKDHYALKNLLEKTTVEYYEVETQYINFSISTIHDPTQDQQPTDLTDPG